MGAAFTILMCGVAREKIEKLKYMHRNPVKRGLVRDVKDLAVEQLFILCGRRGGFTADRYDGMTVRGDAGFKGPTLQKPKDEAPANQRSQTTTGE